MTERCKIYIEVNVTPKSCRGRVRPETWDQVEILAHMIESALRRDLDKKQEDAK